MARGYGSGGGGLTLLPPMGDARFLTHARRPISIQGPASEPPVHVQPSLVIGQDASAEI